MEELVVNSLYTIKIFVKCRSESKLDKESERNEFREQHNTVGSPDLKINNLNKWDLWALEEQKCLPASVVHGYYDVSDLHIGVRVHSCFSPRVLLPAVPKNILLHSTGNLTNDLGTWKRRRSQGERFSSLPKIERRWIGNSKERDWHIFFIDTEEYVENDALIMGVQAEWGESRHRMIARLLCITDLVIFFSSSISLVGTWHSHRYLGLCTALFYWRYLWPWLSVFVMWQLIAVNLFWHDFWIVVDRKQRVYVLRSRHWVHITQN